MLGIIGRLLFNARMSLNKPTIVLFDMDGTVVRHINPALLSVLETLDDGAHKCAKFFSRVFRRKIKSPPLVEHHDGKRRKLLVHRAMHRMRRKKVDQIVEPCPGIYAVLKLLQAHDIPMGLISNGLGKGYGHDILRTFDLEPYFTATIFREDISRAKPYPDPILQALEQMPRTLQADDVIWYIGDRRKDVVASMAAAAHLPCTIQPLGYNLHAAMAVLEYNIGTDHIVMAWPDLESRLRRFFEKNA